MNIFFDNLFGKKSKTKGEVEIVTSSENKDIDTQSGKAEKWSVAYIEDLTSPIVAGSNYLTLFSTIPEVFFPIDYIASRIAGANFQLKKTKDDSIVWANKRMNGILSRPNCLMRWKELIYQHHIYKLCTGNSFIRAAMPDVFSTAEKWRYCDNYWVLPSDKTIVEPVYGNMPLFGIAQTEDIIRSYRLEYGWNGSLEIPPYQIWHDRDGSAEFYSGAMFLKSKSRLASQNKPMSNLIAVYEARNVIYVKRGGLGFIVSKKTDATGSIALTDDEKEQLLKQNFEKYGVRKGQVPYGISDADIDFVRTNLSIAELQPFEETLADAINIAGAYGIPAVLVPRKDQSTFSNQATAEKSVYCSTVIPMAKQFCKDFTAFLGLEGGGYYLDCDFSDVDCLQEGLKESEDVKTNINKRCREQFSCGLITLNDWRAQIGESMIENPLFDKLKFERSKMQTIQLKAMTRELCHELYRHWTNDASIYMDMRLFRPYVYDEVAVNRYFDAKGQDASRRLFAIMLGDTVVGELQLKQIDHDKKECTLSIHMQNDAVKGKGYGTQAERLAVKIAFDELGMAAVNADTVMKNTRSQHVLEKAGFRFVGEDGTFKYYRIER